MLQTGKNVPVTKLCTRTLKLLKSEGFVGGKWTLAKSGKTFNVFNPANGQIVGSVPDMNVEDAEDAILAAKKAFSEWKTTTSKVQKNMYSMANGRFKTSLYNI